MNTNIKNECLDVLWTLEPGGGCSADTAHFTYGFSLLRGSVRGSKLTS